MDELPFRAQCGVIGSWICLFINIIALIASFYVALYPVGGPYLSAEGFFEFYLAGPFLVFLYLIWKVYSWFYYPTHRPLYTAISKIDIYSGMREYQLNNVSGPEVAEERRRASIALWEQEDEKNTGIKGKIMAGIHNVI